MTGICGILGVTTSTMQVNCPFISLRTFTTPRLYTSTPYTLHIHTFTPVPKQWKTSTNLVQNESFCSSAYKKQLAVRHHTFGPHARSVTSRPLNDLLTVRENTLGSFALLPNKLIKWHTPVSKTDLFLCSSSSL